MKLSFFRFLLLSHYEKLHYVRAHASLLVAQSGTEASVELYALYDFWVELHYREPSCRQDCTEVVAFKETTRLQHYTEWISLNELHFS